MNCHSGKEFKVQLIKKSSILLFYFYSGRAILLLYKQKVFYNEGFIFYYVISLNKSFFGELKSLLLKFIHNL
jgi:hypothetical protein